MRPGAAASPRGATSQGGGRFAKSSTKRIAVLAGILIVLGLMLVPALRGYLAQRAQIAALEEEVAQRSQAVDRLQGDLRRWEDPAFVEQQARQRLKFVRPGETSYQVLDADGLTGSALAASGSVVRPNEAAGTTWYGRVWSSLDAADSLSPKDVNAPLAPIAPAGEGADSSSPTTPGAPASSGTVTGTATDSGTGTGTTGGGDRTGNTATTSETGQNEQDGQSRQADRVGTSTGTP